MTQVLMLRREEDLSEALEKISIDPCLACKEESPLIMDIEDLAKPHLAEKCYYLKAPETLIEPPDDEFVDTLEHGYGEITLSDTDRLEEKQEKKMIEDKIVKKVESAVQKGTITSSQGGELSETLLTYLDAFGCKQSLIRSSKLPEMTVKLRPGTRPFKAEYRSMGSTEKEAMRKKLEDLLRIGTPDEGRESLFLECCLHGSLRKLGAIEWSSI